MSRVLETTPRTIELKYILGKKLQKLLNFFSRSPTFLAILLNLARVSSKLGDYDRALSLYDSVGEVKDDFDTLCDLAITCYKAGKYKESYAAYQTALTGAPGPGEKSQVLTGMACIAYKFQGPDAAKTLLFQACQFAPVCAQGLYALCVLGIKQSDLGLIRAALDEMKTFQDDEKEMAEVAGLKALVTGDKEMAKRDLARQIHR